MQARWAPKWPSLARPRWRRARLAAVAAALATAVQPGLAAAHGPVPAEPPSEATLLLGWTWEPTVTLALLVAAVLWWRLLATVDRRHPERPVAPLQRWAFLGGLGVVVVALLSGLARYDTTLFSVHMVQHLLLAFVAPPLLALGAPVTQLLRAASKATRRRWLLPVLHSRVAAVLGHPVVTGIAFAGVMWTAHFSPLFDLALEDPLVHDLEHALFLGVGILFWWPVVSLDPSPRRLGYPGRLLYLFLQVPQSSFLAVAILFAPAPLYPHYVSLGSPYGIEALADQELAAGIMWFAGDVIFLGALLLILAAWMRAEGRGVVAADRRAEAERASIAGRAEELARRRAGGAGAAEPPPQPGSGEASSSR